MDPTRETPTAAETEAGRAARRLADEIQAAAGDRLRAFAEAEALAYWLNPGLSACREHGRGTGETAVDEFAGLPTA